MPGTGPTITTFVAYAVETKITHTRACAEDPITGQPHRIGALDKALEYICSHAGVWRATGWEIVEHFLATQGEQSR